MAKILVVDDDPITRQLLMFQLRDSSHELHTAPGGSVALAMLGMQPYDLVITDLFMPGVSGVLLMERARSHHHLTNLPFIMMTASIGFSEMMPAVASQVAAVLEKPIRVQDLLSVIDVALLEKRWLPSRWSH